MMMKIFCLLVMIMSVVSLRAQQDYFVFIQQPAGLPFYVRMGEDSYSSSAGGHLILSPMKDSLYEMYIGFPRSKNPEQLFRISVDKKDRGFELKQFDGRWQLFDLQKKELVRAIGRSVQKLEGVKRTDTYSELMAGVVDDTTVLYIDSTAYRDTAMMAKVDSQQQVNENPQGAVADTGNVAASQKKGKRKKAKDSVSQAKSVAGDTTVVKVKAAVTDTGLVVRKDSEVVKHLKLKDSVVVSTPVEKVDSIAVAGGEQPRDPRDIIRYRTENVVEGKLMIFLDRSGPVTDTIRIIVPGR